MNKEIPIWKMLGVTLPIIVILIAWANNLSDRVSKHDVRIEAIERTNNKIESKLDNIERTMTTILVELQNKKNRD